MRSGSPAFKRRLTACAARAMIWFELVVTEFGRAWCLPCTTISYFLDSQGRDLEKSTPGMQVVAAGGPTVDSAVYRLLRPEGDDFLV